MFLVRSSKGAAHETDNRARLGPSARAESHLARLVIGVPDIVASEIDLLPAQGRWVRSESLTN